MSKASIVNEIHKNARRNFLRRHVILKDIDDLWQADLIDVQTISKFNSNYRYILIVIDAFSKYAWTYPLKCKTGDEVYNAFKVILARSGRIPKNLQTDLGTEFYNKKFKKLMHENSINHYSTYTVKKASIAERFIRTLKSKMYKQFSLKGNYKWIDGTLDNLVHTYNHTFHRTINQKPADVTEINKGYIIDRYSKMNKLKSISKKDFLKIGDYVRISKYKSNFDKGYTPNWSTEIFRIVTVQKTSPITYLLEDARKQRILGAFYREELQKTKHPHIYLVEKVIKKRGHKVYVKWLGLPPSENSWIEKTNIL